jgi:hypothetical protein
MRIQALNCTLDDAICHWRKAFRLVTQQIQLAPKTYSERQLSRALTPMLDDELNVTPFGADRHNAGKSLPPFWSGQPLKRH